MAAGVRRVSTLLASDVPIEAFDQRRGLIGLGPPLPLGAVIDMKTKRVRCIASSIGDHGWPNVAGLHGRRGDRIRPPSSSNRAQDFYARTPRSYAGFALQGLLSARQARTGSPALASPLKPHDFPFQHLNLGASPPAKIRGVDLAQEIQLSFALSCRYKHDSRAVAARWLSRPVSATIEGASVPRSTSLNAD